MTLNKEALRRELRKFLEGDVDSFISEVGRIVALYDIAPQPPKRSERRKQLEHLVQATETYLDELELLGVGVAGDENMADHERAISRMVEVLRENGDDLGQAREIREARHVHQDPKTVDEAPERTPLLAALTGVLEPIWRLLDELKQELEMPIPIASGRPAANADGLLTQVASAYLRHFRERPTSTKNGTFYNLAAIITGLQAPDRGVQAAVSAIVNPQNPSSS